MITAVCLNPAMDKTVSVDGFAIGATNRIKSFRMDASGKGVNVALTASRLGVKSECVFFSPEGSQKIYDILERENIGAYGVKADGILRTNTKILSGSVVTELNEPGPLVTDKQIAEMTDLLINQNTGGCLVLTGSMPKGMSPDFYGTIIKSSGRTCILDADGANFREGIKAGPYLTKPNIDELEMYAGKTIADEKEILSICAEMIDRFGVRLIAVSMGGDGVILTDGSVSLKADGMKVKVASTVGAGDAMVGGFAKAIDEKLPMEEMLRTGAAAATAKVMTEGTSPIEKSLFDELYGKISIHKI